MQSPKISNPTETFACEVKKSGETHEYKQAIQRTLTKTRRQYQRRQNLKAKDQKTATQGDQSIRRRAKKRHPTQEFIAN